MKALPILLVLLMLWSAIWRPGPGDYVARELELELPTAQTTDTYDDHGGFHGDGLLHTELTFSPEDGARVEEAVSHHPSGTKAPRSYDQAQFRDGCYLFFGKETAGLPLGFREEHRERCIRIPMRPDARSLNLANSVAVVAYEALRQLGFPGLSGQGEMAEGL